MLAMIAGQGALPAHVVRTVGQPVLICAYEGVAVQDLQADLVFRVETLGSLIADLKVRGVDQLCFAGAIGRPVIDPSKIDAETMPLVPMFQKAMGQGDDGALRAVVSLFEQQGFAIRAAHDLCLDLLPDVGCPSMRQPDAAARADAERGEQILAAMGQADIGQACIVHRRQALAIEARFGTDWMLRSLSDRPDGRGGLLFKAPKPEQDRRIDLPVIGPDTVTACTSAGLDGLVIAAQGVMVLDLPEVLAHCDAHGLFLWIRESGA